MLHESQFTFTIFSEGDSRLNSVPMLGKQTFVIADIFLVRTVIFYVNYSEY